MENHPVVFEKWKAEMEEGGRALVTHDVNNARKHFETAVQEAEKFGHNNSSLAESLEKLGESILAAAPLENEDVAKCFECYERACSIYEAIHGPVHLKVADCLTHMSRLLLVYDFGETEKLAKRAVSIYQELGSSNVIVPIEVLAAIHGLSSRTDERDCMLRDLVRESEEKSNEDPILLAKSLMALAKSCQSDSEAVEHFRRALSLIGENSDYADLIVDANVRLGKILFADEQFSEAEDAFNTAILFGECSPIVSSIMIEEALCRLARMHIFYYRDFAEAEKLLTRAEQMRDPKQDISPIGSSVEIEYRHLAQSTRAYDKYEGICRRNLDKHRQTAEIVDKELVDTYLMLASFAAHELATIVDRTGNHAEAIDLWERALKDEDQRSPEGGVVTVKILLSLAIAYARGQRLDDAKALADRILKDISDESPMDSVASCLELERTIGRDDYIERVIAAGRKHIKKAEQEPDDKYGYVPKSCLLLSLGLAQVGRMAESKEMLEKALEVGLKDSLFRACGYEEFVPQFIEAGAPGLAKMLEDRAQRIRELVVAKEKEKEKSNAAP